MSTEYFIVLGVVGVAFFAVSGALLGHDKSINGFGEKPIFWVETSEYLLATYSAIFATVYSFAICLLLPSLYLSTP